LILIYASIFSLDQNDLSLLSGGARAHHKVRYATRRLFAGHERPRVDCV
jgi:hypothetical protein